MNKRLAAISSSKSHEVPVVNELELNDFEAHNSTRIPKYGHTEDLANFVVLENAPNSHKFKSKIFLLTDSKKYYRAVKTDHQILRTSLPPGVWVKVYEDRIDLLSVMIEGPKNTPYEDGIFLFDFQLDKDYPLTAPRCHYISYSSDRLNPNLYEEGKVCVSLLDTWTGDKSERWGPGRTLLQVIVSIQGLILVAEPYFNEDGFAKQKGKLIEVKQYAIS